MSRKPETPEDKQMPGIMGMSAAGLSSSSSAVPPKVRVHQQVAESNQAKREKSQEQSKPAEAQLPIDGITIRELSTDLIDEWDFVDRHESEFGKIEELTSDIKMFQQRIPALVRPKQDGRFELIYGRRRLTACRDLGIDLKVFVRALDDEEAFIEMVIENKDREDISTWSRAMSFKKALDSGIYPSQGALAAKLNISRTHLVNMMAYTRIPEPISQAIGPMHKVGVDTAVKIAKLAENEEVHERLIELAGQIASGKLNRTLEKAVLGSQPSTRTRDKEIKHGDSVVGKWRKSRNGEIQVTIFPNATDGPDGPVSQFLASLGVFGHKHP